MTDCCYSPLSPIVIKFNASDGCGDYDHSVEFSDGDFITSREDLLSAFLIQLGTRRHPQKWWGEPFLKSGVLGAEILNNVSSASEFEEILRRAIDPLIQQGLIDDLDLNLVETVDGFEVSLSAWKNGSIAFQTVEGL